MATGAIDGFRQHVVVGVLLSEIAVTVDAGIGPVHRRGQPSRIDEQRDFFASGIGRSQGFGQMTIEAGRIFDFGCNCWEGEAKTQKSADRPHQQTHFAHNSKLSSLAISITSLDLSYAGHFLQKVGRGVFTPNLHRSQRDRRYLLFCRIDFVT
jgi:hypothetical protein